MCHDVTNIVKNGVSHYTGASLDEINILETARDIGICRFVERDNNSVTIELLGKLEKYSLLRTFEFNSDRKMMTVITQNEQGKKILFSKGADLAIIPRLKFQDSYQVKQCIEHVD